MEWTKVKFWVYGIVLILAVGFSTLYPSFNLALTGDDYLGLWRYNFYLNGYGGETLNNIQIFFSDYGPQDTITALIHSYFEFNHRIYYIFSFLLRTLASLSFLWPVYKLTKNKWASIGAGAFFLITVTGLETTDWSFNMPSYVSIAILNIYLGIYLVSRNKRNLFIWTALGVFFVLTIVTQPIRMVFLPLLAIGIEFYRLLRNLSTRNLLLSTVRIAMYIFMTLAIFKFTNIGGDVSARGVESLRKNYGSVEKYIANKNTRVLITPISQLGIIIFPNQSMYQRLESWGLPRTFRKVVLPAILAYVAILVYFVKKKRLVLLSLLTGAAWTLYIWKGFMFSNPFQPFELLTYLLGGYFLILIVMLWFELKGVEDLRFGLVLSVLIIILGFMVPWLRNPGSVNEITGRYLIVSGAGLTWLVSIFIAISVQRKLVLLVIAICIFFGIHAKSSHKYLYHLSNVRGIELTDSLRNSVKRAANFGNTKVPIVFYFEGDDPEILHHAFIFGWPVISSFQFGNYGSWYNIAPTDKWEEVVSAYIDGESLKRFMPGPYVPAKLEDIYSYRLENRRLIDESEEKRKILKTLKKEPQ